MKQQFVLNDPLDMHLHLRDGDMLKRVAPYSARYFSGALIMPNLVPPVTTLDMVKEYKRAIKEAVKDKKFEPYMTLFFKSDYDYDFLKSVKDEIIAIKLYPAGITTNSEGGVEGFDIEDLKPTLSAMSELGIPLCIHGESSGFVMDREAEFIPVYEKLAKEFDNLKIVMEHITTAKAVEALNRYDNLYATITLHHLSITLDDVAGGLLKPHLFCKPIAKRPEDKEALLKVALEGNKKVMFGSDSAPHPRSAKEAPGCAAGVYTAPIALQALTEIFDNNNSLDNLQKFVSDNAREFYGIEPLKKRVTLVKEQMVVNSDYEGIVPFKAGDEIGWSITDTE